MCGTTVRLMSPSDEPQKTVNDVKSLVGGALRAGICRMEDEEGFERVKVDLARITRFGPVLRFAFHSPGFCFDRQGGSWEGFVASRVRRGRLGRTESLGSTSRRWRSGSSSLLLFVCDGRVFVVSCLDPGLGGRGGRGFSETVTQQRQGADNGQRV